MMPAPCKIYQFPGDTPFRPGAGIMAGGAHPQFAPGHTNSDAAQGARCCPTTINKRAPLQTPQCHVNSAASYRATLQNALQVVALVGIGFATAAGFAILIASG